MSASGQQLMIEARGLGKYYGPFAAIQDVSFSIPRGQVAAFLGPNGAGKSTTMKVLTGYLSASAGEARIGGFDVFTQRLAAAQLIGYLPENGPLYLEMTPEGLLRYTGEVRGIAPALLKERLDYVAAKCSLGGVWGKPSASSPAGSGSGWAWPRPCCTIRRS